MTSAKKRKNSRFGVADINANVDHAFASEEQSHRSESRFFPLRNKKPYKGHENLHNRSAENVHRLPKHSEEKMPRLVDVEYKDMGKPQKVREMKRSRRFVKIEWEKEPEI